MFSLHDAGRFYSLSRERERVGVRVQTLTGSSILEPSANVSTLTPAPGAYLRQSARALAGEGFKPKHWSGSYEILAQAVPCSN